MSQANRPRIATASNAPELREPPQAAFDSCLFLPPTSGRLGEGGLRRRGVFKRGGFFDGAERSLVSVVTVVRDGAATIAEALDSVLRQEGDGLELIVVDGGSTDGTLDILQRYDDVIDYWVSEPDGGIYDAMNKGLRLATGTHVLFLNADDCLRPLGATVRQTLDATRTGGVVFGPICRAGKVRASRFDWHLALRSCLQHQGVFAALATFKRVGLFDTRRRVLGDYDMALRLRASGAPGVPLAEVVADCRPGGLSGTGSLDNYLEEAAIKLIRLPWPAAWLSAPVSIARFVVKRVMMAVS